MKQFLFSLTLVLSIAVSAKAGVANLSPFARVSVLTCDPGTEPYAIFGHSAIRVKDSLSNLDVVFNYGTFDFDDPHFYQKFLRGRLIYFLSASTFDEFLPEYKENHQRVREQVLALRADQVQRLWERLNENLKEENKYYKYDFFYDNCSTRIREDIKWVYGDSLHTFDGIRDEKRSFRQEITPYFRYNSWTGFGIDICLGMPADKMPTSDQRMFLPWNLFDALQGSTVGQGQSIISSTITYNFSSPDSVPSEWDRYLPDTVCWTLVIIGLLVLRAEAKYKRKWIVFENFLFTITGLIGVAFVLLWCFTDHTVTKWNQNLLWASPFNLIAIWVSPRLKKSYFLIYSTVLSLLCFWFIFASRYFDSTVLPLTLLLFHRSVIIVKRALGI